MRFLARKVRSTPPEVRSDNEPDAERGGFGARFRKRPGGEARHQRADKPGRGAPEKEPRRFGANARVRPRGGKATKHAPKVPSVVEPMRIAKAMARAGLCSRREAERWIADGRVSLNGQVLKTPAVEVKPKDRVLVDGQPLPIAEPSQLWRYNKPKGLVTTHNDPQGRPTVFDNLPPGLPRVISVGRLDFNTEGLILLTNDGELARHLELPATGWLRRYRVRAKGRVVQADLDKLKEGVEIEGVRYGPVEAAIDTVQGANMWLTVGIREGKNREVRKVLTHLGLDVNRLIRVSFGPFQLMDLEPGQAESIKRRILADQLGPQLAAEFGLVEPPEEKSGKKGGGRKPKQAAKPKRGREGD
jgi:23S rRNA pseudouridine2605 synthase